MGKLLSIITINFNNKDGLERTINSVVSQTRIDDIEFIVIDGASTDGSCCIMEQFSSDIDKRVSEQDKGIYNAMNKGVYYATGDYCLFLNSGDVLHDNDVIAKALTYLDGTQFVIGRELLLNSGKLSSIEEPLSMLRFYKGSIPHQATFIRRDVFERFKFDESYKIVSDWKFFLQTLILENMQYKFIDMVISDYDCSGISSTRKDIVDVERAAVYEELFPRRMMLDYLQFEKGGNYSEITYDKFFVKLRDFRSAKLIYSLDVLLLRFVSLFKRGLRFASNFPIKYKDK